MKKKVINYLITASFLTVFTLFADTHTSSAGSSYPDTKYNIQKIIEETAWLFDENETAVKVNEDGSVTIYITDGNKNNKDYEDGNITYTYPIAIIHGVTEQ